MPPPPASIEFHQLLGVDVSSYQAMIIGCTALMVALTSWFYARRTGKAILAIAEDRDAALLRGIDPGRLSCVVGGALAGFTGILAAPMMYASVALGPVLLIRGFEAVAHGPAGELPHGQQRLAEIARALVGRPRLLMLDEPSLGLAPVIVDQVMDVLLRLRAEGCAILLVEQLVERALDVADFAYVMRTGHMLGQGPAAGMRGSDLVASAYL